MWKRAVAALALLAAIGAPAMAKTPTPDYIVLAADGDFEVREYGALVAAEVVLEGEREKTLNQAFQILFDYITGANEGSRDISMTAPVTQEAAGAKIAMTAPVTQEAAEAGAWRVRFLLPADYTAETAPKPTDARVQIVALPPQKRAAVRFSGLVGEKKLRQKTEDLMAFVEAQGLTAAGPPVAAYYNGPFTLPFLRRNEVLVAVE